MFRSALVAAAALIMLGCGNVQQAKPELPSSISPGWQLKSFSQASAPAALGNAGSPVCWRADYQGQGSAEVWVCGYLAETGAFDAVQRARTEAQMVKFQVGKNLVLVRWNGTPKVSLEALIRAVQKTLK